MAISTGFFASAVYNALVSTGIAHPATYKGQSEQRAMMREGIFAESPKKEQNIEGLHQRHPQRIATS